MWSSCIEVYNPYEIPKRQVLKQREQEPERRPGISLLKYCLSKIRRNLWLRAFFVGVLRFLVVQNIS